MATQFDYTSAANIPILQQEIEADAGITTAIDFIVVDGTSLSIHFVTDLSGGEITALDAVVAAHTGIPSVEPGAEEPPPGGVDEDDPLALTAIHDRQFVDAVSEAETNSESYVDLDSMTLTTREIAVDVLGSYQIWFTCIFDIMNDNETGDFRLLIDGVEEASGTFNVEDDGGQGQVATLHYQADCLADAKEIKIQFKPSDDDWPVKVSRRSLMIDGISQATVLTS